MEDLLQKHGKQIFHIFQSCVQCLAQNSYQKYVEYI